MVNDKYVVKYLDPRTGKYEYATIKDVGDLQKLNTKVKTSIVDAINSISTDGIDGLRNDLDTIGKTIKSLEDGTLELGDFQSIDDVVSREIEDAINNLKDENSGLLKLTQEEIDKIISDAESEYRDSIAASVRELETSKSDLEDAREKMTTIGQMLENADIDYSNLTQVVDDINLYITDVIEKTDFDMVNGIISDYETAVTQTEDGWGVDASRNMLSYLTGRVKSNETSLDVQHGLIQAKVGKDEFQYMTVDNLPAGKENMLHNTSDLRDWDFSSAFIFKSADDYRFTSIVQSDSAGEHIIGTTDELEQGVTYAISTYVNVQNKNKEPGQEKYAPTDGLYTATVIIDGDTIELNNVVEDNSALDGWKRVSGTFIAKRTAQQDIKFYVTSFNRNTQVGYLSAPKLEKGSSATSWIPHIEDNVSTILSQNAVMRVLADRITSSVEEVRETKGAFETATSTFDQMADGFKLNTNKLSEVLDKYGEVTGVQTQQASQLEVLNDSITSKVWKQDINTTLDTINIDTSNRIVNSAFNIYSYDEQTGKLKLDYWDNNTGFEIKKHSQSIDNYLYAKRSNATSVNPISIKSSPFALRDGEKILFNFEYLAVGHPLDDDNVFTLEMYDNDDVRVGLQEFRLSDLKKEFLTSYDVGDSYKYNGTYIVKNSSVVKGTITLKLPKNGELWLTKVMLQNAGIGTIGWTPSSIDNQIIQSKLSTEINQLADSIELVATDERLDAISGLLVKKDGKVTISPEAIVSRVTSQELGDNGLVTQTSIKQTEENLRFDLVDKEGVIQTINASSEGLLIDFDKVQIDGELIARMISAQSIDATQGFRLTDNNGNTLLAVVNDNGKPTLSIAKDFRIKFGEISDKLDVTIVGVVEEYYYSVDPDETIGGRWTSTPNAFQGGDNRFIWKRTKIIYQSGDTSYYPNETGVNITGSWEYEKESVTAEVVRALDSAEDAKELAVSEANQAMIDANKYADEQDALIKQQVNTSVSNAISEADQAKQIATDSYNNAVSKAEELAQAQSEAFNKKFEENASEMDTLSQATQDADAKAQEALSKAGTNANLLSTHQNTLNTIKNTTIPNVNKVASDAMAEAKAVDGKIDTFKTEIGNTVSDVNAKAQQAIDDARAVDSKIDTFKTEVANTISTVSDSAKSAMDEAKKTDGKIADYVTRNGLVSGTTVDTKINDATGEISKKITTVEGKIDDLQVGGRNLVLNSSALEASGLGAASGSRAEYQTINTGQSYMDLEDGEIITISFDLEMKIATKNPSLMVYNTNKPGLVGIPSVSVGNQIQGDVGETINKRISFTTNATLRDSPKYSYNTLEFFSNYGSDNFYKISKLKVERGNVATDWTPAPEDNYTQEEFKIFEASYNSSVEGITSRLGTVENNVTTNNQAFTTFKENEYKRTAERVSDTFTKQETTTMLGAKADASQLSNYLAKSTYERDAEQSKERFETIESDLGNISVGGRNLISVNDIDVDNSRLTNVVGSSEFIIVQGGYAITSKIPVKTGEYLTITNYEQLSGYMSLSFFDKNDVHVNRPLITEINDNPKSYTYKIPDGITYARASYRKQDVGFIKLERGNKATDWSPAVEDMANLSYVSSEVTKSAEAIKTSLANYAKTTDLNGLATETYATNQAVSEAGKVEQKLTGYAKTTDLNGLATETYATNKAVSEAGKVKNELTKYELKTGVDSKISTASSALRTETAEKMKTVYTKTETETLLGKKADSSTLNNYVQTATYESGIDGVSQSLTRVEGKVDGLKVGGRNFILNSGEPLTPYSNSNGITPSTTTEGYFQIVAEPSNGNWFYFTQLYSLRHNGQITNNFKQGDDLTFSIDIKSPNSKDIPTLYVYGANNEYEELVGVMNTEFSRFHLTVNFKNSPTPVNIAMGIQDKSGTFIFRNPKIEKGNVATDWAPAPEDMQSVAGLDKNITAIYKNESSETAKAINQTLSAYTTTGNIDGHVASLLSNTSSQTAQGFNSKLTEVEGKIPTEIGGRNLFIGANTYYKMGGGTGVYINLYDQENIVKLPVESNVTISFDIRIASNGTARNVLFYHYQGSGYGIDVGTRRIPVSTEWVRYAYTGTFKHNAVPTNYSQGSMIFYDSSRNYVEVKNVKVEKGKVPTDYTIAPEEMQSVADLDSNITAIYNNTSSETAKAINKTLSAYTKDTDFNTKTQSYLTNKQYQTASQITTTLGAYTKTTSLDGTVASYLKNSTSATAGAINTKLTAYQTTTGLDSSVSSLLSNTNSQTAKGFNSKLTEVEAKIPTYVGGRNLIKQSNMAKFASSGTFDSATNTWDLTAQSGASHWGSGISITGKDVIIPNGSWYTISFEIYTPVALNWNVDVNTYPVSGAAWRGNDNDLEAKRLTSSKALEANKWTKCWIKVSATHPNATGDIYDNTNFGLVNNTGSPVSFKIRNVKGELGDVVTDWTPAPEDMATVVKTNEIERTADYSKMAITNLSKNGVVESSSVNANKDGITERVAKVDANGNISYSNRDVKLNSIVTSVANANYLSQQIQTSDLIQSTIKSKIDIVDLTGAKTFTNLTGYNQAASSVIGYLIIRTPISSNNMVNVHIGGYNYATNRSDIDIDVSFYRYTATSILNHSYSNKGNFDFGKVQVGTDSAGRAVIVLGLANTSFSYPKITVDKAIIGHGTVPDSYIDGWSISISTDLTGIGSLANIDGMAIQSQVTQLSDSWSMKLKKADDVVTQINATSAGVLIQGKNIQLDGNVSMTSTFSVPNANIKDLAVDKITGTNAQFTTMITKGLTADVITSTMIKADTALFNMLFSTTLATDRLSARDAWITNANIVSLDASKITAGTISAARLDAKKIVTDGLAANVIKSEHILGSTALIDKIFADDAYITRLTGKTAFISSIKAIDISASKITSGTLDASKITVSNLSASSLTTGTLDANRVTINNLSASRITSGTLDASKVTVSNLDASSITANQAELVKAGLKGSSGGTLELTGDQLLSTASDGSQVYLQNGVMAVRRPTSEGGGTIGQIGYVYDGGSPTYTIQTTWGSHFALKQRFYDSYTKLTKDKRAMYISTGDDGVTTMQFYAKDFILQGDKNLRFGYDHYINGIGNDLTLTGKASVTVRANERTIFVVSSNGTNNYASMHANLNMQGNTVTNTSDIRLKRNIVNDEIDSLSALMKWQHAGFNYINPDMNQERQFSVIAQSAPDLAFAGEDGYLQVALNKQVNMTSHAVQQLGYKVIENDNRVNDKIKELENKITMLELELKRVRG